MVGFILGARVHTYAFAGLCSSTPCPPLLWPGGGWSGDIEQVASMLGDVAPILVQTVCSRLGFYATVVTIIMVVDFGSCCLRLCLRFAVDVFCSHALCFILCSSLDWVLSSFYYWIADSGVDDIY